MKKISWKKKEEYARKVLSKKIDAKFEKRIKKREAEKVLIVNIRFQSDAAAGTNTQTGSSPTA